MGTVTRRSAGRRDCERVDAADFPVYVALGPPAGLEENDPLGDLTSILHQRIGGPGLYVVGNEHGSVSWETYGIPVERRSASWSAESRWSGSAATCTTRAASPVPGMATPPYSSRGRESRAASSPS